MRAVFLLLGSIELARGTHNDAELESHPLVIAVRKGRVHRMRELIEAHDVRGPLGGYVMCEAVFRAPPAGPHAMDVINELLRLGVSLHAQSLSGNTALHCAAELRRHDLVGSLLDIAGHATYNSSGINRQNRRGVTALVQAINVGSPNAFSDATVKTVQLLLSRGAAVDLQSREGFASDSGGMAVSGRTALMNTHAGRSASALAAKVRGRISPQCHRAVVTARAAPRLVSACA